MLFIFGGGELRKLKKPLDLLTLDCTAGILTGWRDGHLSFDSFLEVVKKMKALNVIDENTKVIANHFSHNGLNVNYKEFCELAEPHGFTVSFDGMEIEL